jgi:predicted dithiol-disulfide oxidoreductase (DUF899 family)
MTDMMRDERGAPNIVDRSTFQAELDALRVREKAHTREGDAIAAARRRLPMVAVDGTTPPIGERGALTLLDAFEGRRLLIPYYFMWYPGDPAPEQCGGCTWCTTQVRELDYLHSHDVTYATFKARTKRAPGTATSWAGRCRGTRPKTRSAPFWRDAGWARCTSFVNCDKDPVSSRRTGRRGAALRQWTTATRCST